MSDLTLIGLTVLLLFANAFFVGAEFALISARRTAIEPKALEGQRSARTTLRAMERVSVMLACAQLGITVCSLGLGSLGEPAVAHVLEGWFETAGIPESLLHPVSFAIALALIVSLHVVIGEMVPKNMALAAPDRYALLLTPALVWIARATRPIIALTNGSANGILRALRVEPKDEVASAFTRDEVAGLVAESLREGLLDDHEEQLLTGALEFEERMARTVLLPIDEVVTLPVHTTPRAVEDAVARTGFSRFPVVDREGVLSGYLHLKDVLRDDPATLDEEVSMDLIRSLPSVDETDRLRDVLATLQRTGAHLATVTDGSGTVLGLVALEDVLEELVGEITDELNAESA
ncbi:MAG: HlyC/CorC family transporter [Solirubrobacteraceae bacterium]|nr:HlyC/CorC family transporter [Solirubrobacteraceae bacterium]